MKKQAITILISAVALVGAPCYAGDVDVNQSVGVMSSQSAAPVAVNDATIEKAIKELLKQQQKQNVDIRKKIPNKLDNPVGEHPLRNPNLILGGAEALPM